MGWIFIREWSEEVRRQEVSRKRSRLCVLVERKGGVVEGEEFDPNHMPFFFSFFFLYHVFIVFRYNKLRVALGMEKTKPINQNKQPKKPFWLTSAVTKTTLGVRPFTHNSYRKKRNIRDATTQNYIFFTCFLQGRIHMGGVK